MNIVAEFSPNNTIRGIYTITWTPPEPTNGSFYQILQYSYSSAYTVGPAYNGSFTTNELNQSQNQSIFDAFYYTNYNFTITTVNIKYKSNVTNRSTQSSNQSSPAGTHKDYAIAIQCVYYCMLQYLQLFVILML